MANEHPFQTLFETLGRLPSAHADSVNRQAYQALYDVLTVPLDNTGRCILLRAPRAGHGKTHLLSRMHHHLGASHEFIALHAGPGSRIDAASVTDDTLRRLLRPLPAAGGLCVLDLLTRRLFSMALQPLVASGEVPCQDREGALSALRMRPVETFDFHHPNAVTAHWARENFEILGQRLSMEIAQRGGLPVREVAFWVDALFQFAATPVDQSSRMRVLADAIHLGDPTEGVRMDRLIALLGMVAMLVRVVLVADDLEGFSSNETAALGLAAFLGSLRQFVDRLDVILSLNQDVWDSAFVPRLTGGLADRLSEILIELGPLNDLEMLALLESRVPGLGSRVLEKVDRNRAGTHARGVIRAAGIAWVKASEAAAVALQSAHQPVIPDVSPPVVSPSLVEERVEPGPPLPEQPAAEISSELLSPASEIEKLQSSTPSPDLAEVALDGLGVEPGTGIVTSLSEPPSPVIEGLPPFMDPSFAVETEPVEPPTAGATLGHEIPLPPSALEPEIAAVSDVSAASDYEFVPTASSFQVESASAPPAVEPVSVAPSPDPMPSPSVPEPDADPPKPQDTDRVDELLRQFRERYGRGNP